MFGSADEDSYISTLTTSYPPNLSSCCLDNLRSPWLVDLSKPSFALLQRIISSSCIFPFYASAWLFRRWGFWPTACLSPNKKVQASCHAQRFMYSNPRSILIRASLLTRTQQSRDTLLDAPKSGIQKSVQKRQYADGTATAEVPQETYDDFGNVVEYVALAPPPHGDSYTHLSGNCQPDKNNELPADCNINIDPDPYFRIPDTPGGYHKTEYEPETIQVTPQVPPQTNQNQGGQLNQQSPDSTGQDSAPWGGAGQKTVRKGAPPSAQKGELGEETRGRPRFWRVLESVKLCPRFEWVRDEGMECSLYSIGWIRTITVHTMRTALSSFSPVCLPHSDYNILAFDFHREIQSGSLILQPMMFSLSCFIHPERSDGTSDGMLRSYTMRKSKAAAGVWILHKSHIVKTIGHRFIAVFGKNL